MRVCLINTAGEENMDNYLYCRTKCQSNALKELKIKTKRGCPRAASKLFENGLRQIGGAFFQGFYIQRDQFLMAFRGVLFERFLDGFQIQHFQVGQQAA